MRKYSPAFAAALAQRFLEPGDSVLEIGAADGEYTRIYAARVGPQGEVLAVEPQGKSRQQGATACPPWVRWCDAAVGAEAGMGTLYTSRRLPKIASLYRANVTPGPSYVVPVTTVDTLVATLRQAPALIHVDAQGAEAAILGGAARTLTLPVVWVLEVWPQGLLAAGADVGALLHAFAARGYVPESPSGIAVSWAQVDRQASRSGLKPHGHFDLVVVPQDRPVAVSA